MNELVGGLGYAVKNWWMSLLLGLLYIAVALCLLFCCQLIFWRSLEQVPHCYPLPRPRSPRRNLYAPIKVYLAMHEKQEKFRFRETV